MEMPTAPPPQSQRKRVRFSYSDDSDGDENRQVKKVRFPKGKKEGDGGGRSLGVVQGEEDEGPILLSTDPRVAALERATRRDRATEQLLAAENTSVPSDGVGAEEEYDEEDEERVEDGMRIEPFNLKQEREEGYFDAEGNYVEYRNDNDVRDAWFDSVEVDTRFAGRALAQANDDSAGDKNLSKGQIAGVKRRIADALQSGETVLRALRRLKGKAQQGRRGEQMSPETKALFDQLTEDAMKLLDDGDYNVYEEKKETFLREAEGYEALTGQRSGGSNGGFHSSSGHNDESSSSGHYNVFTNGQLNTLNQAAPLSQVSGGIDVGVSNGKDIDIFGGSDDEDATGNVISGSAGIVLQTSEETAFTGPENFESVESAVPLEGSGYIFDETSGYYYNSEIGYYYDANSGLYCSAFTGRWYKYDDVQNSYEEVTQ